MEHDERRPKDHSGTELKASQRSRTAAAQPTSALARRNRRRARDLSSTDCRIAGAVTLRSLVVLTPSTTLTGFELGDNRGVATTDYH
jgi:hypothetical protein